MAEYLIYFNQQWVGDHSSEWFLSRVEPSMAVVHEMEAAGVVVYAGGLEEDAPVVSADATSGELLITDGPYVETKEHLGGLTIVDVETEDEARMWAGRIAEGCGWPQEVRRFKSRPDGITGRRSAQPAAEPGTREYLIYFDQQWVGDHTAEWFRSRGPLAMAVVRDMEAAGVLIYTGGLVEEIEEAFSADATSGEVLITDGPYVETKEFLGGLAIAAVSTEDEARMWAGRIAEACGWPQELRRFGRRPDRPAH
ncbi:MAG TPA: YciI family protein [Candidatus Nanopelagicales bacterium]|nr:YciI family protein [Candidatus Nanopelagicales bacterium]